MTSKKLIKLATKEFETLKDMIGFQGEVEIDVEEADEAKVVKIDVSGPDLGYMIGNKGKHMLALQFILGMIIRRKVDDDTQRIMINLDIGGYRQDREDKVEQMALQKADDARILGEPVDMEPMNPADRRIAHMTLQKFDDIKTESEGEGMERFVKIIPSSEEALGILDDDIEIDLEGEAEGISE